jgi:hypothetical protein
MRRYALQAESDGYTVFQVLRETDILEIGETVSGNLEDPAIRVYRTGRGKIGVFAEKTRCKRTEAAAWVSGALASAR